MCIRDSPHGAFLALLGPQGPHESMGATPRPPQSPPEAPGAFTHNLGFWPPGGSPSTAPKPIKTGLSEGVGPIQIDPECFFAPGRWPESLRIISGASFHDFFGSGVGERGPGPQSWCVRSRAFLAGAFFSVKNWAPGPKAGVLGLGRSSQGRFFPSKMGPQAPKLVC